MYMCCATLPGVKLVIGGLVGFEWDAGNWRTSELKHGVAAAEAQEVLLRRPLCQVDERHSDEEQRHVALGTTAEGRHLFVSFTIRTDRVRMISARPMSRKERVIHDQAQPDRA
jgi:uncharacterized DUF497 family protein